MDPKHQELFKKVLGDTTRLPLIHPEDIPSIPLYMDQVTSLMEDQLASTKRNEKDKILTKTMINNYAKNKLLPPPDKKKYSREHMLMLVWIYYMKGFLSLHDIQSLLGPIGEKYFQGSPDLNIETIYNEICESGLPDQDQLLQQVETYYQAAAHSFENVPEKDQEFLRFFKLISCLCMDVYLKKQLIESLIDAFPFE